MSTFSQTVWDKHFRTNTCIQGRAGAYIYEWKSVHTIFHLNVYWFIATALPVPSGCFLHRLWCRHTVKTFYHLIFCGKVHGSSWILVTHLATLDFALPMLPAVVMAAISLRQKVWGKHLLIESNPIICDMFSMFDKTHLPRVLIALPIFFPIKSHQGKEYRNIP